MKLKTNVSFSKMIYSIQVYYTTCMETCFGRLYCEVDHI